jgi:Putative zinc-finger
MNHHDIDERSLPERYVSGTLSSEEASSFEEHLLECPECLDRVERNVDLRDGLRTLAREGGLPHDWPGTRSALLRAWPQAAAVLLASGLAVLAGWRLLGPHKAAPSAPAPTLAPMSTTPSEPLQPSSGVSTPATPPLVFDVPAGRPRAAGDGATLRLSRGADRVLLRLEIPAGAEGFRGGDAALRVVGGREVWRGTAILAFTETRRKVIRIEVPAARLRPDDYIVEVSGTDRTGGERDALRYAFRVRDRS